MLPAAPPPGPGRGRRTSRGLLAAIGIVVVAGVAGTVAVLATRSSNSAPAGAGPLHVGNDVSLTVSPSSGGCGTTFTFVATGSLTGTGKLVYRWEQSDGRNTPDLSIAIDKTVGSFDLHQSWRLEGSQQVKGSMIFHILRPNPSSASAKITYSCS